MRKLRREFKEEFPYCWCCANPVTDCHEIARGGVRCVSEAERCCWIAVCRGCHERSPLLRSSSDPADWAVQLALKWLFDREHYDRRRVLEIKMIPEAALDTAVTDDEVLSQVAVLAQKTGIMWAREKTWRERQ